MSLIRALSEEEIPREVKREVSKAIERAEELAKKFSDKTHVLPIIGRVSSRKPITFNMTERTVVLDIEFPDYFRGKVGIGDYIAVANIIDGSILLMEVQEITRRDIKSIIAPIAMGSMQSEVRSPERLMTPAEVVAKVIAQINIKDGKIHVSEPERPPEPGSPVFYPAPEIVMAALSMPEEGITLGILSNSTGKVIARAPVKVPIEVLFKHMLVLGTTGSRKTTLLKNMIVSGYWGCKDLRFLILDARQDFPYIIFPRCVWKLTTEVDPKEEEEIAQVYMHGIERDLDMMDVEEVLVVRPVMWSEELSVDDAVKEYVNSLLKAIDEESGIKVSVVSIEKVDHPQMRKVVFEVTDQKGRKRKRIMYVFIYGMLFWDIAPMLPNFLPEMKESARQSYPILIRMFKEDVVEALASPEIKDLKKLSSQLFMQAKQVTLQGKSKALSAMDISNIIRREHLRNILRDLLKAGHDIKSIYAFISYMQAMEKSRYGTVEVKFDDIVHPKSKEHLVRLLTSLMLKCPFMDKKLGGIPIREPNFRELFEKHRVIVVDTSGLGRYSFAHLIIYRFLDELLEYQKSTHAKSPWLVMIDEAHLYFPSGKRIPEEKEAIALIEEKLTQLIRLGRRERIGLIFATHDPRDLNSIAIQQTNTKVYMRSERKILEYLDLDAKYRASLELARKGKGLVRCYIYAPHYIYFRTCLPLCFHKKEV